MDAIPILLVLGVPFLLAIVVLEYLALTGGNDIRQLAQYMVPLLLVTFVVIAALMLLGPTTGEPFSTINHSLNGV